jgi:serine protease AprX
VTRAELASALVLGARVPQYLPANARYTDVADLTTMIFVESVQSAPSGPLFYDAQVGGQFRPEASADRLTAAVALVRALGLDAEARSKANTIITANGQPLADSAAIAGALRGYVQVAIDRGLINVQGASFNPQKALTRAELAHAMAVVAKSFE